jgi:hypothetical protein
MLIRAAAIWILGLVTLVPYGAYYLFFHAPRQQYALLITLLLFWIFGYWGVVGPILSAIKTRRVFRAIESAQTRSQVTEALRSQETEDVVVQMIASENRIPRFVALKVYRMLIEKIGAAGKSSRR